MQSTHYPRACARIPETVNGMDHQEFEMERAEAQRYPCPYVYPQSRYSKAEPKVCGAQVGETCRNPLTGAPIRHRTAHLPRLRAAGLAARSTVGAGVQPFGGPVDLPARNSSVDA